MKNALAHKDGRLEIPADGNAFPVHSEVGDWVQVADDVSGITYRWENGAAVLIPPPPPPTLAQRMARLESVSRIARNQEEILDHILNGTPISPQVSAWLTEHKNERNKS